MLNDGAGARGAYFKLMSDPSAALAAVDTQERIWEQYERADLCPMRCLFSPDCIYAIVICMSSVKSTKTCMSIENDCTLINGP